MNRVIGHTAARLRLAKLKDRLPPALIFAGPSGIGKKQIALQWARELTGDMRSLDLTQPVAQTENIYYIQPDGATIKIEQAREAIHFMSLAREGRRLVFIFDEAQNLGPQAANALLKSIEEPPEGVLFLFLVPGASFMLPTIRSRSQVVNFAPLANDEVLAIAEQVDPSLKLPPWLLEMSMGSVGVALELARGQGAPSGDAEGDIETIHAAVAFWFEKIGPKASDSERSNALGKLKECLKERDHHQLAFRMLVRKMLNAWRLYGAREPLTHRENSSSLPAWLIDADFEKLEKITDLVFESESDLARNVDRQLLWEQLSSRATATVSAF